MDPIRPVLPRNPLKLEETVIAKDQPQYRPLPAIVTSDGVVTSRWRLTWRERLRILFCGSLWLQLSTFGHPLQPVIMTTEEPVFALVRE